jgi:hypothetical protein
MDLVQDAADTRPVDGPGCVAAQHNRGTITIDIFDAPLLLLMNSSPKPREVFIQGLTLEGRAFRPSDWAERLAGVMSGFRPGGAKMGLGAHIGYSPYCVPRVINGIKCVIVNEELRQLEPMAWDFVMNFARDNHLQVTEACLLPEQQVARL